MRHWFYHIVALIFVCDLSTEEVSDDEYDRYVNFMKRHGFDGAP
jgi:hypothetical protein